MARSPRQLAKAQAPDGRRAERHKYVQFLWFHCVDGPTGGLARSIDVSDEGVGFVASHEVAVNERLFLVLLTPLGKISTLARVMHCQAAGEGSFRIGVRVELIPPTDKAAWTSLLEKEDGA